MKNKDIYKKCVSTRFDRQSAIDVYAIRERLSERVGLLFASARYVRAISHYIFLSFSKLSELRIPGSIHVRSFRHAILRHFYAWNTTVYRLSFEDKTLMRRILYSEAQYESNGSVWKLEQNNNNSFISLPFRNSVQNCFLTGMII